MTLPTVPTAYVQYGCGLCAPHTWRNFDASPTLQLQRIPLVGRFFRRGEFPIFPSTAEYGDIVRGLPIAEGSCQGIYCSHVLEHLALDDFRIALRNTYQYLANGGIFRFVLPDLEHLASEYLSSTDSEAAHRFMEMSYLGVMHRLRGPKALLRNWLGNSAHLWMWDFKAIRSELQRVGFQQIRRAVLGDSPDSRFNEVEDRGRWEKCLGIECLRLD